jgi:hypothetical protein
MCTSVTASATIGAGSLAAAMLVGSFSAVGDMAHIAGKATAAAGWD